VRNPAGAPWQDEARRAIDAAAIGIAAEISQREGRLVERKEIFK